MSDFLTIIRVSLLPTLTKMVADEEKHLHYLESIEKIDVTNFINTSRENLAYLRKRHQQYTKYIIDNSNDIKV